MLDLPSGDEPGETQRAAEGFAALCGTRGELARAACAQLARMKRTEQLQEPMDEATLRTLVDACSAGGMPACLELSHQYEEGGLLPPDPELAAQLSEFAKRDPEKLDRYQP